MSGSDTICANESHPVKAGDASAAYGSILWTKPPSAKGYISTGATTLQPTYVAGMGDGGSIVNLTMTVTSTNTCFPAKETRLFPNNCIVCS